MNCCHLADAVDTRCKNSHDDRLNLLAGWRSAEVGVCRKPAVFVFFWGGGGIEDSPELHGSPHLTRVLLVAVCVVEEMGWRGLSRMLLWERGAGLCACGGPAPTERMSVRSFVQSGRGGGGGATTRGTGVQPGACGAVPACGMPAQVDVS